jgi:hypothetical protein
MGSPEAAGSHISADIVLEIGNIGSAQSRARDRDCERDSFRISVVPPKIAMTGLRSVHSPIGREFLPFTTKIWPVTRSLPRAPSPDPSTESKSSLVERL